MSRRAALFDMDRTLLRVNTGRLWLQRDLRAGSATPRDVLRVSWWLAQYAVGVLDVERLAVGALATMRGREEHAFRSQVERWVRDEVLAHASPLAEREVRARRGDGYLCAVLTGSTCYAAEPVAQHFGIEHVLATRLGVDAAGRFTGDYERPLPYRGGKVALAERWAAREGVDLARSVFFTDSITDLPMLLRVGEPVVINPDPLLWLEARRRRWPVRRW